MNIKMILVRIIEFTQYVLFRVFCFLLNLIPFSIALSLGKLFGRILYQLLSWNRNMALQNLRFVFGKEKNEIEIREMARQSFENLGMFAIELVRIPKVVKNMEHYVVIENEQSVFKGLEKGKGVILVVSHFGNWEWMGVAAGVRAQEKGVKISAVARPLGNPFLYRYAVEKLRGATGLKTIDKKGATLAVTKLMEQNEIVCVLIDQHERHGSVPVPYFGRDAWTPYMPAAMALKKGSVVIPVFSFRGENAPTVVKLGEPFPVIDTGNYERDLTANTTQYIKAIEEVVRKRPGDWLWMHARWRAFREEKVK